LISPTHATLEGVCSEIITLSSNSPNCTEVMSKYKKQHEEPIVAELKVKWNAQSHDPKIFPASTIVTKDNFKAVVKMIGMSGVGRDVFEVRVGSGVEEKK
jgi:hypothetical protein